MDDLLPPDPTAPAADDATSTGPTCDGQAGADAEVFTRFGAPLSDPNRAAALLRAIASRHGVTMSPAAPIDLAAAVIGADAWMMVLGRESFDRPASAGPGAARTLSRVLMRACGQRPPAGFGPLTGLPVESAEWIRQAEAYVSWARQLADDRACDALLAAADDLAGDATSGPLVAFSQLLVVAAEYAEADDSAWPDVAADGPHGA